MADVPDTEYDNNVIKLNFCIQFQQIYTILPQFNNQGSIYQNHLWLLHEIFYLVQLLGELAMLSLF